MSYEAERAIAKAATPGPWFAKANDLIGGWCVGTCDEPPSECADFGSSNVADFVGEEVARYIAIFNPEFCLGLLDKLERYETVKQRARILLAALHNEVGLMLGTQYAADALNTALIPTEANDGQE